MKINVNVQALCVQREQFRGIPYFVTELINVLSENKYNKIVASFYDFKRERNNRKYINEYLKEKIDNIEVFECNSMNWKSDMDFWEKNTIVDDFKYDYEHEFKLEADVHFFPHTFSLPRNLPLKKTVVTVHDLIPYKNEEFFNNHPNRANRFSNVLYYLCERKDILIVTHSNSIKKELIERAGISSDRLFVVPLAYNNDLYWRELNDDALRNLGIDGPFILYLGAMDERKGIEVLCEAFSLLNNKDIKLVLAGGNTQGYDVEAILDKLNCRERIIRTGFVTDEQKRVLMSMAEIFVFPSYSEGFGLPVLEAMACGTPVITSNSTSLPEVGGDAVVYFEAGNIEELTAKIKMLLDDMNLQLEYQKKGFERCKQYSWKKTAELYEDVFEKLKKM